MVNFIFSLPFFVIYSVDGILCSFYLILKYSTQTQKKTVYTNKHYDIEAKYKGSPRKCF